MRACEVFDGAPLLPSKLSHASVMQGFKNDCFYVAAMALLASKGSLVNSNGDPLIRPGKTEGEFVATLVEKAGGETVEVTIDDMIPVSAVSGQPLYAHARDGDALCFSLLEKALAKRFGSFAALDGGNTSEALWELTGCAVEDVKLDGLSGEACAKLVRGFLDAGELIGCGHIDTAHRGEYCANASGIRSNHAYAVVGATAKEVRVCTARCERPNLDTPNPTPPTDTPQRLPMRPPHGRCKCTTRWGSTTASLARPMAQARYECHGRRSPSRLAGFRSAGSRRARPP